MSHSFSVPWCCTKFGVKWLQRRLYCNKFLISFRFMRYIRERSSGLCKCGLIVRVCCFVNEAYAEASLICILISLYLPLPRSGGRIFKSCVWFSGWLPPRPSRRAGSWHWAPSSATVAGRRHRRGRQVPWLTDPLHSSSGRQVSEPPGASMEVSVWCLFPLHGWILQDAEMLLQYHLNSLLEKKENK